MLITMNMVMYEQSFCILSATTEKTKKIHYDFYLTRNNLKIMPTTVVPNNGKLPWIAVKNLAKQRISFFFFHQLGLTLFALPSAFLYSIDEKKKLCAHLLSGPPGIRLSDGRSFYRCLLISLRSFYQSICSILVVFFPISLHSV